MSSLLKTFRASSTTGCAALHRSLKMRESIFLNKNEMVFFIGWMLRSDEAGDFLYTLYLSSHESVPRGESNKSAPCY
jgi:hypothetical protein